MITFRKDGRTLRINAALELSKTIWSKYKLAQRTNRHNVVLTILLRPQSPQEPFELNIMGVGQASRDNDIQNVVLEYQDIFLEDLPKGLPPDRGRPRFKIELANEAEPHNRGIYRMFDSWSQELLRLIRDLIEKGFTQACTSPWGAPVLFAAKKDDGVRLCMNYRALNK